MQVGFLKYLEIVGRPQVNNQSPRGGALRVTIYKLRAPLNEETNTQI